jgi:hypothetical protein
MKRVIAIIVPVILVATAVSFAQNQQQSIREPGIGQRRVAPEGTPPGPGDLVVFVGSEMGFGGKVIKDAPYSAEAITEEIQVLADGNRIVNKTSSMLYRDSEGRTRREQTLKPITTFAPRAEPIQTIFINDPVAGVSYSLNTRTKVAHKNVPLKLEQKLVTRGDLQIPADQVRKVQKLEEKIEIQRAEPNPADVTPEQKLRSKIEVRRTEPTIVIPDGPRPPGEEFVLRRGTGDVEGFVLKTPGESKNVVNESLGQQLVEGVLAEGSRTTLTIPAGEIGNERDILVVSERWYSPELRMVVMTKHSDPRTGETIYRLTNINRLEPAKELFELPAGYTVTEGYKKTFDQAMPPKVRKPE